MVPLFVITRPAICEWCPAICDYLSRYLGAI